MSVRTLHCSSNIENYNLCLDRAVAGFGKRGPESNDKVYLLIKDGKKTFCGARFDLADVTAEKPWEDADRYVLCYSIKNIEYCKFFDVRFLSQVGGKYWNLKYLQGSKAFDAEAEKRIDEEFNKNRCDERQYIKIKDDCADHLDEQDEIIEESDIEEILKEIPEAEIKIM